MPLPMIRDLFAHQAWADAEMWHYLGATPAAHTDKKVLELLGHIHAVQRFFLSAVQDEPLTREELTKEIPLPDLRDSYREFHIHADRALSKMRDSRMKGRIRVPWFPDFQPTVADALTQVAMHTQGHRAQILMLLRQLGGDPKPVDYIIWVSKNRPEPQWNSAASA
jgi:uncharacterized damage-inducible protein DinB